MSLSSKRLTILIDSEKKDLFGAPKLTTEEKRFYFTLNDLEHHVFHSFRNRNNRIYFILLLGYFKIKPVILNPTYSDTKVDLRFIAEDFYPNHRLQYMQINRDQKTRIYQRVLKVLKYRQIDTEREAKLLQHVMNTASIWIDARYLFDDCIDYLAQHRIAIPKYTVLQRIVSKAIQLERGRVNAILSKSNSDSLSVALDEILYDRSIVSVSEIRQSAKNFSATELEKELAIHHCVTPLINDIDTVVQLLGLSLANLKHYASLVDYYTVTKLRRFNSADQRLYLLCYIHIRHRQVIEHLADGFVYHCRKLQEGAKAYAKETAYREWQTAAENMSKAADLLHLFIDKSIDESISFGKVRKRATGILSPKDIDSLCLYLSNQKRSLHYYAWEYYDQQQELLTTILRPIFLSLHFQASPTAHVLGLQIQRSQEDLRQQDIITAVDCRLIQPRHQPFVIQEGVVNADRFEVLLYLLASGKLGELLFIPKALKYSSLQDDLVGDPAWKNKQKWIKESLLDRINHPPDPLMKTMEQSLAGKLEKVSTRIRQGDHRNVVFRTRTGKTQWRLPSSGEKKAFNNPFFEQLKQVNVADLLRFVDQETSFLKAFEHVRQVQSKQAVNPHNLMAILIANGTNYGLYRMAHISDRSYEQLRSTQANYLRLETLNQANDTLSNATAQLEIFKYYNIQEGSLHASADGQKYESRLHTFKTRYSSKYFGTNKGVSAMTLVANHIPINARVIGANEHESHYIFDLLFNNTSEIKPDILSTDTHGVNHVNFALLDLFGYTFAPRYAKFSHVIDDLFIINESNDKKPMLTLKKPIRTDLIINEWEMIQRIVISLQQKSTTQASLIRKLSTYGKRHPLLLALTEYNRMIKAMYILDYIDDASLRSYVQRALNRGEAYHQLRRAVASVNGNRFRGSSDLEIEIWNESARLLANAIIYFNSLILSKLLAHFTLRSDAKMLALVKKVSPVAWLNVNLNGTYSFSFEQSMINLVEVLSPFTENG